MAGAEVHIDEAAIRRLSKRGDVKAATRKLARQIADNVEGQHIQVGDLQADGVENITDIPVIVSDTEEVQVILAHPAGVAVQAKYGALTKAASSAGVHVGG